MRTTSNTVRETVRIPAGGADLVGDLVVPEAARGLVVFAHGSGSGRTSPRNQLVANALNDAKLATLLFDLLTPDEVPIDEVTRHLRFDIGFLATRLVGAVDWTAQPESIAALSLGLFGASTGASAALVAAASRPESVSAVVSRGGRPDLVMKILDRVRAPTLLIVGGQDLEVVALNERAFRRLRAPREMVLVDRASHLFEEPGAIEEVSRLAASWFERYLVASPSPSSGRTPDPIDEIC
jgi:pimeloyl-ACP methyl ester carboxylesterase